MMRLNDAFPQWMSGSGIFSTLQNFDVPWKDEDISLSLDIEYHGNHSGSKIVSPIITYYSDSKVELDDIAKSIISLYGRSWSKLWDTLYLEYNPIENYSMEEITTDNNNDVNTTISNEESSNSMNTVIENVQSDSGEVINKIDSTTEDNSEISNSVYGFNSDDSSNSDAQDKSSTITDDGISTETRDLNSKNEGTNSSTGEGSKTNNINNTSVRESNKTLTRHGNIGVTTSQQMIESERAMWVWNFFHDTVFKNIDSILTLKIY